MKKKLSRAGKQLSALLLIVSLCLSLFCALLLTVPANAESLAPKNSAKSAILIHADTGTALFSQNADEKMLIASTTKIMTALVVIDIRALDEIVTITDDDVRVEGSSMYLKVGQDYTVEQLLYGMMLASGNDASMALARYCGGSIAGFAAMMNKKAKELNMADSSFANPHGLDAENHRSTAADMAKLTAAAMKNETFRAIVSAKTYRVGDQVYKNHNKMLFNYDGALGVKTGYTKKAGRILVSAAERDGLCLICVTISDPDDWKDHAALFDWAFARYEWRVIAEKGEYAKIPVISGTCDTVSVYAESELRVLLDRDGQIELRVNMPRFVFAPLRAGKKAGSLQLISEEQILGEITLKFGEDVKGIKKR